MHSHSVVSLETWNSLSVRQSMPALSCLWTLYMLHYLLLPCWRESWRRRAAPSLPHPAHPGCSLYSRTVERLQQTNTHHWSLQPACDFILISEKNHRKQKPFINVTNYGNMVVLHFYLDFPFHAGFLAVTLCEYFAWPQMWKSPLAVMLILTSPVTHHEKYLITYICN